MVNLTDRDRSSNPSKRDRPSNLSKTRSPLNLKKRSLFPIYRNDRLSKFYKNQSHFPTNEFKLVQH